MNNFLLNFIGVIAIGAMIYSLGYTWLKLNRELKSMK
jgi:hypothetical protein